MLEGWAWTEFSGSRFHDLRRVKSLCRAAEALVSNRGRSHSSSVGNGLRQATGDAFSSDRTTPDLMLEGHFGTTCRRCGAHDLVLAIHDTTDIDFTSHLAAEDMGCVNNNPHSKGIFAHSSLAATEDGIPLGLVSVSLWTRKRRTDQSAHGSTGSRPIEERESYKWLRSLQETARTLGSYLDSGGQVILIGDRESDIIDLFAHQRHPNMHLLVRSYQARRVKVNNDRTTLPRLLASTAECGRYDITVPGRNGVAERHAQMGVKYAKATLLATDHHCDNQEVWAIQAEELGVPSGVEPLSWTLLTTSSITSFDQAKRAVDHYAKRWLIERLHYTLKSGCLNVERLQFDDVRSLMNAIAYYYVIAWQVLWLSCWSKKCPDALAEEYLQPDELIILRKKSKRPLSTLGDCIRAIAELGGYVYYPKAGPPGVKLLSAGRMALNLMVDTMRLLEL